MPKGLARVSLLTFSLSAALMVLVPGAPHRAQEKKQTSSLIGVPMVVTDSTGRNVTGLQPNEIEILEDGVKQKVNAVQPSTAGISVVLLLDTSISTQAKLGDIRRAALVFVDQLQKADRIKVISFDDQVREANDFTADRAVVKKAIQNVQSGYGTKFYDGVNVALESLKEVDGPKAMVIFSDGVDYKSDYATAESTMSLLEQDGVLIYPIRFSTRAAAEKTAREQAGETLPTEKVVRSTSPYPSERREPDEVPSSQPKTGPLGLPSPEEIIRRRRDSDRGRDRLPPQDRPPAGEIGVDLPTGRSDPRVSSKGRERKDKVDDPIKVNLDRMYNAADSYLQTAAEKSGGQLLRADDVASLPAAFSQVANELRAQYFLTYEPANQIRDGKYHTIKVTSSRPGLSIRARSGRR